MKIFRSPLALAFLAAAVMLAGCASTEKRQSAGEYIDDAVITAKVKTALLNDDTVEGFDIEVETYDRVVQLSGFVDAPEDIRRAGEVTRGVKGVKSVRNDLRLKTDH